MTPYKTLYMKPTLYNLMIAAVVAGLLAACSAASPDDNKKAQVEKLKAQQAELAKKIQKLEAEIDAATPDSLKTVKAKDVEVVELKATAFDHYVQTQGQVESENNVMVSAKSMGVITQVYVNEGDQVSKGQVLAQIDNSVIMRGIESMKSQLELATSVYERQKNLWDQKIGTEVQFLQAKTNKESLEKQLASLQEQNEMTKIKAPITGTVDDVWIKVGENATPGIPTVRIVNTSDLKIRANVSEAFVTMIKKGNKALVSLSELQKDIEARVTFVGRTIDPLSRTFTVEIKLPANTDLRPNMTATVKVIFNSEVQALVVPVNVIQEINNEKVVYIAESKGKQSVARRKVITVKGIYGGNAQVEGLSAGDKLITIGYQGLNDGDFVKI